MPPSSLKDWPMRACSRSTLQCLLSSACRPLASSATSTGSDASAGAGMSVCLRAIANQVDTVAEQAFSPLCLGPLPRVKCHTCVKVQPLARRSESVLSKMLCLLDLPDDCLELIASLLEARRLGYVCRRLWILLQYRFLSSKVTGRGARRRMNLLTKHATCVRVLTLEADRLGRDIVPIISAVSRASHMHTLRLHMPNNKLADRGASSFSRLSGLVLRSLQLDLRDNNIGCDGLRYLMDVLRLPSLRVLDLWLTGNRQLEEGGAPLLAGLKDAPLLHTVSLALSHVGDIGAQALSALKDMRSLQSLELRLWWSGVGPSGVKALAALKAAPHLHTLVLVLTGNPIANEGAKALAELAESESLRALMLHLCRTSIGNSGAQALAMLRTAPALRTLRIFLENNLLCDEAAAEFARLAESPTLCQLQLSLGYNFIGDAGAMALATLSKAKQASFVGVSLVGNPIHEEGKTALYVAELTAHAHCSFII
eukprot:GGOE01063448.1.p1 GENE.GGOE01063448.1~~GGOE01063448.1.p1  ORF type:complete len:483 (-),score=74.68 GGOE01063448.1:1414-2862(-)